MDEKTDTPMPANNKGQSRAIVIGASIVGGVICLCLLFPTVVIAVMRLLGPKIGNTFSTINSSLP
ncbi:MAG: hypothetical protein IT314_11505 [Anaerolineales bacterium]|nr:hypothetical protein [Anaerolineales bacterium]